MKSLILSNPKADHIKIDNDRFSNMVTALGLGGIEATYYSLPTKDLLQSIFFIERPDIVFCADYYTKDESNKHINIHSILDDMHIPYIGSSPSTLNLVISKSDLKAEWCLNDVPTPAFFQVSKAAVQIFGIENLIQEAIDFPYILKPNQEGNSRGLDESSIVFNRSTLKSKLENLLKSYEEILVEKYLGTASDLREFTVAMIGNGKNKLLLPAEITLKQKKGLRIITTQDKDNHLTQATPVIENSLLEKLNEFAERAFETACVRDYSRCDLLMADGHLYAVEINGLPMIPDKWFEICASGIGLNSTQYINAIFLAGIVRNIKEGLANLTVPLQMKHILPTVILDMILQQ